MKKVGNFFILLSCFTALSYTPFAQQKQSSGWFASFNTIKLNKHISIHFDAQLRSSDEWQHVQTLLVRPGINFHIRKNSIITAGYTLINARTVKTNTSGYFNEHRIWQQLILLQPVENISIQHRFRFEERFIPQPAIINNELIKTTTLFATRLRYFARAVIPFHSKKTFTKGFYFAVQNEVFVNTSNQSNTNNNFFDQNRVYIAAGNRLVKKFDVEIGFMNQHINGRTANTSNNIIQLATYLRL